MKILVTGSRDWNAPGIIYIALADAIKRYYYPNKPKREDILIIHGGAKGADTMAGEWATEHNIQQKIYKPDWQTKGRSAGMLRNQQMLDDNSDIDVVLAFWKNKSRGTGHMIKYAQSKGKQVIIYKD